MPPKRPFVDEFKDALKEPAVISAIEGIVSKLASTNSATVESLKEAVTALTGTVGKLQRENEALQGTVATLSKLLHDNAVITSQLNNCNVKVDQGCQVNFMDYAGAVRDAGAQPTTDDCPDPKGNIQYQGQGGSPKRGWDKQRLGTSSLSRPYLKTVRGQKGAGQSSIRAVERRICVFVGRLHKDTTEEELMRYLSEAGIPGTSCKKLENNSGRYYRSAAFQVFAPASREDAIYDADTWPEDCSVREWLFKSNTSGPSKPRHGSRTSARKADSKDDVSVRPDAEDHERTENDVPLQTPDDLVPSTSRDGDAFADAATTDQPTRDPVPAPQANVPRTARPSTSTA